MKKKEMGRENKKRNEVQMRVIKDTNMKRAGKNEVAEEMIKRRAQLVIDLICKLCTSSKSRIV